jgi:hypothetical protein
MTKPATANSDPTIHHFRSGSGSGKDEFTTRAKMVNHYGINPGSMTDLLRQRTKTTKGWAHLGPAPETPASD